MKKKTVYKGKPVSVDVYNLTVEGRKVRREIIHHPGAAAILAFDENGKVILVKQHRFPHGYILLPKQFSNNQTCQESSVQL